MSSTFNPTTPLEAPSPYAGDYAWSDNTNWEGNTPPPLTNANVTLPTESTPYTAVDDVDDNNVATIVIGDDVTMVIASNHTVVDNINGFGANSLFRADGEATVSIQNGLGGAYEVNGATAVLNINQFNGQGAFSLNAGTINFEGNGSFNSASTFNFEGVSRGEVIVAGSNNYQNGWSFPVTNFGVNDSIMLGSTSTSIFTPGTYALADVYNSTTHTLTLPTGGNSYVFQNFQLATGTTDAPTMFDVTDNTVTGVSCFAANTRIRVPGGEVAVETLRRGDLVLTSAGSAAAVSWVGVQTVSTRFADPLRVLPIRIKAGALAENVPSRDLLLSPDHAILIDDLLLQAGALVNGVSIVRETRVPEVFVYYHVETDDHSLILAEDTPAETFIDNVDRMGFDNWADHEALYPLGKIMEELPYPRAKAHRQIPMQVRARLAERARAFADESKAA